MKIIETPTEVNRRERRGVALTALNHLLNVAVKPYEGDRPSQNDMNDSFRTVLRCVEEFESEANDKERQLSVALRAQPPADSAEILSHKRRTPVAASREIVNGLDSVHISPLGATRSTPAPQPFDLDGFCARVLKQQRDDGDLLTSEEVADIMEKVQAEMCSEGAVPTPTPAEECQALIDKHGDAQCVLALGHLPPCSRWRDTDDPITGYIAAVPPGAAEAREPLGRAFVIDDPSNDRCKNCNCCRWEHRGEGCVCGSCKGWEFTWVAPAGPRDVPQTRLEMLRWHLAEVQRLGGSPRALAAIGGAIAEESATPRAETTQTKEPK